MDDGSARFEADDTDLVLVDDENCKRGLLGGMLAIVDVDENVGAAEAATEGTGRAKALPRLMLTLSV